MKNISKASYQGDLASVKCHICIDLMSKEYIS